MTEEVERSRPDPSFVPAANQEVIYPLPIRQPVAAGAFYPANPTELRTHLDTLLEQAVVIPADRLPQLLIVPHAATMYAGPTAATGFKRIIGKDYDKVILLGPSHKYQFSFAAVDTHRAWQTPLGITQVDEELSDALVDPKLQIVFHNVPHKPEYSLELELIFLQRVLKEDFTIVPILVSHPAEKAVIDLAQKISQILDDHTLLVVSSDLSHNQTYEAAKKIDRRFIGSILSGDRADFETRLLREQRRHGWNAVPCGFEAIRVGLQVAENLGITNFHCSPYQSSGDIEGTSRDQVVGYTAIAGWRKEEPEPPHLSPQATNEALSLARRTLTLVTNGQSVPEIAVNEHELLQRHYGVFVTLKQGKRLRGCIGSYDPGQYTLAELIQRMIEQSALHDSRFQPMAPNELDGTRITISVLTPRRDIRNWQDIKVGEHGVCLRLVRNEGVFLPQVATEEGWDLETLMHELCLKARLPGFAYRYPESGYKLSVFRATVIEESYKPD